MKSEKHNKLDKKIFVFQGNIFWWTYGPVFIGLVIIIGSVLLADIFFNRSIPFRIGGFIIGAGSFIAGLGGVPQILRKETPGRPIGIISKGLWAVFSGFLQILLFCGGGIVVTIATIIDYY